MKKLIAGIKSPSADGPDNLTQATLHTQKKAADYLNSRTAGWSLVRMKIALTIFCLIAGTACLFLIGKAILSANGLPEHHKIVLPQMRHIKPYPVGSSHTKANPP